MTDRIETGKFTYSAKTKSGYSLKMTGSIYGPKHGNVVVAALDSQLEDDVNLLDAAHDLLIALKEATLALDGFAKGEGVFKPIEQTIRVAQAAISKAEGRS